MSAENHLGPTQKVETISDGCLYIEFRQRNSTVVKRRKHRPKSISEEVCLWKDHPCPDHPNKEANRRRGAWVERKRSTVELESQVTPAQLRLVERSRKAVENQIDRHRKETQADFQRFFTTMEKLTQITGLAADFTTWLNEMYEGAKAESDGSDYDKGGIDTIQLVRSYWNKNVKEVIK